MKTYLLEPSFATGPRWAIPLALGVLFTVTTLLFKQTPGAPPPELALVFLPVGLGMAVWSLRLPRRIEVAEDGTLEWIAPLRRIRLRPADVISIAPDGSAGGGLFMLTHSAGRFRFANQFTGFHELLTALVKANPTVQLRGC